MYEHNAPWGDLVPSFSRKSKTSRSKSKSKSKSRSPKRNTSKQEALEDYTPPNISLRKAIWENFPVVLTQLEESANGADRYAVTWHNHNLQTWRKERSESWDEYMEYESWVETRLLYTLERYSHLYKVEPPRSADQICVLVSRSSKHATRKNNTRVNTHNIPTLRYLNDIKANFPVVWPHTGKITKGDILSLEFHRKNLKTMAEKAGVPFSKYQAHVESTLLAALRASDSWEVLPPEKADSICRLRMLR